MADAKIAEDWAVIQQHVATVELDDGWQRAPGCKAGIKWLDRRYNSIMQHVAMVKLDCGQQMTGQRVVKR